MTSPSEYAAAFRKGKKTNTEGLCARVLKGVNSTDFSVLSPEQERRVVFFMGPDGLRDLPGLSGHDILKRIGYDNRYIKDCVNKGKIFKLAVFKNGESIRLADWDGAVDVVKAAYPEVAEKVESRRSELKKESLSSIQSHSDGFDMMETYLNGPEENRFMTPERLAESDGTLVDVRAFLFHSCGLRSLYAGDGYTRNEENVRGLTEYIGANGPVDAFGEFEIIDLDVKIPRNRVANK